MVGSLFLSRFPQGFARLLGDFFSRIHTFIRSTFPLTHSHNRQYPKYPNKQTKQAVPVRAQNNKRIDYSTFSFLAPAAFITLSPTPTTPSPPPNVVSRIPANLT